MCAHGFLERRIVIMSRRQKDAIAPAHQAAGAAGARSRAVLRPARRMTLGRARCRPRAYPARRSGRAASAMRREQRRASFGAGLTIEAREKADRRSPHRRPLVGQHSATKPAPRFPTPRRRITRADRLDLDQRQRPRRRSGHGPQGRDYRASLAELREGGALRRARLALQQREAEMSPPMMTRPWPAARPSANRAPRADVGNADSADREAGKEAPKPCAPARRSRHARRKTSLRPANPRASARAKSACG